MYSEYEPDSMKDTFPICWEKARDWYVWDNRGKKYIDFTSGIFVANVGHSNSKVINGISNQLYDELLYSFAFPTKIRKKFVNKLMDNVPDYLDRVALFSEGGVATDKAVQMAREFTGKRHIVMFKNSYHGSTSMWMDTYKSKRFKIAFPEIDTRDFNKDVRRFDATNIAAIILEGYQGWSAYFWPKKYVQDIRKWCNRNNVVLIFDEIQSGFKRTGPFFCFEHYDVKPDIVCFGKGVSSSLPLSGVLAKKVIMDSMEGQLISNTHSGNALCMAAGYASLKALNKIPSEDITEKGEKMMNFLKKIYTKYDKVDYVTGKGLLAAIHFTDEKYCDKITKMCIDRGLMLVRTRKTTLKIGPPLNIPYDYLSCGLSIIGNCLEETKND